MRGIRRAAVGALTALTLFGSGCAWNADVGRPVSINAAAQSSKIYASDGTLLTTLHAEENREDVPLTRIAKPLRDAVVAIEDRRFWKHGGVDVRALLRAAFSDASKGRVAEGGSTITQQYVKNSLLDPDRTLHRKLKEASLAYRLERRWSKAQILEGYLNTIYFGNGAYGAQAAAGVYFGTTADKLTLPQAALLAGIIRSPRTYDPYRNPSAARARRAQVLSEMVGLGTATRADADAARGADLGVADRPAIARYPAAHFVEEVKQFLLDDPRFGKTPSERQAALFSGGLRVYTTIDLAKQALAEDAVAKVLARPDVDPEAAMVSLEPRTGEVRALVGGRDFFGAAAHAKFDLATQHGRPAGSSFKPLVLTAALQKGIPLDKVYNAPSHLSIPLPPPDKRWEVDNYEDEAGGRMNLLEATVHSINTVYAQLILDVGPQDAVNVAKAMGVQSTLRPFPSAVLGTNDVTPLDMAAAYATLANRGIRVDPVFVTRVTKADGTVLFQHQRVTQRVVPRDVADTVTAVLQQVVQRGTGVAANIGRPVAGKTGTGQEWRDAWFVGFTPDLVSSVWVGFPEAQRSMVPPVTRIRVTGGSWPAQIWQLYTSRALAQVPVTPFALSAPPGPAPPAPPSTVPGPPVQVPQVVGLPFEEAAGRLQSAGLAVVRRSVPNDDYPPGYVVGQSPAGGSTAPGGSAVTLDVSSGRATTATVPDVLGMTEADACATIQRANLRCTAVTSEEPQSRGSGNRKGRVWRQNPTAGTTVDRGETVTITVNPR